jgi:hypothetical protein
MRHTPILFLAFFGLLWSAGTLSFDFLIARDIFRQLRTNEFVATDGQVTESKLVRKGKSKPTYVAEIHYTYTVGGKSYSGDRVTLGSFHFGSSRNSHQKASALLERQPKGSQVRVFYNPTQPGEAVLQPGIHGGHLFAPLFLMPFNAIMVGLWYAVALSFRPKTGLRAARVRILDQPGFRTAIRMPHMPPFMVGFISLAAAAFVGVFVIAFATAGEPSFGIMILAWSVLGSIALWAGFKQLRRLRSGAADLTFEEGSPEITLPIAFDRKERVTISREDIKGFDIELVSHRSSKGGSSLTYRPRIHTREGLAHRLASYNDREGAEALVALLRERLGLERTASFVPGA